jgi:pyrroloquinoline quinone (PQQ) biosynthesis protein C
VWAIFCRMYMVMAGEGIMTFLKDNSYEKRLLELVSIVKLHPAVNNSFYDLWTTKVLTIKGLSIFARNYWEWTRKFPECLSTLIKNTKDTAARVEYTATLHSELGNGNWRKAHVILFENFYLELAKKSTGSAALSLEFLMSNYELEDPTKILLEEQGNLYGGNTAIAVGAQLAIEWQAYTMMVQLYEGARLYLPLWDIKDEFHEACEFFYTHIGATEKEHKISSLYAAQQLINSAESFSDVEKGFIQHLELISNFWQGLFRAISRL